MGQVWRAEDTKLGREVALKVLPQEFAEDPERMARFEREAKVLASLNHPNIATLYGLETAPVVASEVAGSPSVIPSEAVSRVEIPEVSKPREVQIVLNRFTELERLAGPGGAR